MVTSRSLYAVILTVFWISTTWSLSLALIPEQEPKQKRSSLSPSASATTATETTKSSSSSPAFFNNVSRRDVLVGTTASVVGMSNICGPSLAKAADAVDMEAINAARAAGPKSLSEMMSGSNPKVLDSTPETIDLDKMNAVRSKTGARIVGRTIVPISDPSPILTVLGGPNGKKNKSTIQIPRVGYSFYKTPPDQAARCTTLALRTGVKHFDVATMYGSNIEIAKALKRYLDVGMPNLDVGEEKSEVLDVLDATALAGEQHAGTTFGTSSGGGGGSRKLSPPPLGSAGRRGRREGLFISHKISNDEQSTDATSVRRAVKAAISELGCSYLDMVSLHSPLTDKSKRLTSYQALLDLRDSGFVRSVGVCNFGLAALQELESAGLELPAVNQIELSPFNAHGDVVDWCDRNEIAVACSAWSRLSSADGPVEQWDVVAKMAQQKGMTKAQILVRWSVQKGYICVPRSAAKSKIERIAIAENSYGGINSKQDGSFMLTAEEMAILDGLDVKYKAGKLGRRDGWTDGDVTGQDWDPTDFV